MTHPSRSFSRSSLGGIKGGLQMAKAQSSPRSQTLNSKSDNNNNKVYYLNNKSYHRQSLLVTKPFGASSKFQSFI